MECFSAMEGAPCRHLNRLKDTVAPIQQLYQRRVFYPFTIHPGPMIPESEQLIDCMQRARSVPIYKPACRSHFNAAMPAINLKWWNPLPRTINPP
jgi:hypothetical protein